MSGKSFGEMLKDEPSEETEVENAEAVEAPQETTEQEEQPKEEARPRDESGRFAKKGEEGASPAPDDQEFDGKATIGERRRRQEAEARLAELETEIQRLKTPQQQQEQPDWFADPEAREKHLTVQFQEALYQRDLNNSERFARLQHGDDVVEAAVEWGRERCSSDPYFNQKVAASGDPVGYAVAEYQRDQLVNNVKPEDYAEFQKWREAQANPGSPAQVKPPPTISGERNVAKRGEAPFSPSSFKEMLGR